MSSTAVGKAAEEAAVLGGTWPRQMSHAYQFPEIPCTYTHASGPECGLMRAILDNQRRQQHTLYTLLCTVIKQPVAST